LGLIAGPEAQKYMHACRIRSVEFSDNVGDENQTGPAHDFQEEFKLRMDNFSRGFVRVIVRIGRVIGRVGLLKSQNVQYS